MIEFKTDLKATEAIRDLLSKATVVKLAVAYWGEKSSRLIESDGKVKIICNLDSGACKPSEIRKLMDVFGDRAVKNHPLLHAKVYWTDRGILLGSSNVSTNGLALGEEQSARLKEANVLITDNLSSDVELWFDALFNDADFITDDDLKAATECWKARRAIRDYASINQTPRRSLFETATRDPDYFLDKPIFVTVSDELLSDAEKALRKKARTQENDSKIDSYSDWTIDPGSYVLDFWCGARGAISYQGLWKIPDRHETWEFRDHKGRIVLCRRVREFERFAAPDLREGKLWAAWLRKIYSRRRSDKTCKGIWDRLLSGRSTLSLYDFSAQAALVR